MFKEKDRGRELGDAERNFIWKSSLRSVHG